MSKYTHIKTRVQKAYDSDDWCWVIFIDGGVYAEGVCATEEEATDHCNSAIEEWKEMTR